MEYERENTAYWGRGVMRCTLPWLTGCHVLAVAAASRGSMMGDIWKPHQKNITVLKLAMEHVQSVPYRVSLQWLFYRLLQDGVYRSKEDHTRMKALFAAARNNIWNGWRPDWLADETRRPAV